MSRAFIDLFAGCGGLSLGMEQAGFKPILVSELNRDALDTYLANRKHKIAGAPFARNKDLHFNDVKDILDGNRIKKVISYIGSNASEVDLRKDGKETTLDLLVGGPPCQGFSRIGFRRSYAVDRKRISANLLYREMAEVIRKSRPRIFLFENVVGMRSARWTCNGDGSVWKDVLSEFSNIPRYTVRWAQISSRDYGVPQNRPRVLLVGMRNDLLRKVRNQPFIDPCSGEETCISPNRHGTLPDNPQDAITCGFLPTPTGDHIAPPDIKDILGDLVDRKVAVALSKGEYPDGPFVTSTYQREPQNEIQEEFRTSRKGTVSKRGDILLEQEYSKHSPRVVARFQHMIKSQGTIPAKLKTNKFSQRWLPPKWGKQGPFMTVASLPDDYVHFSQPRSLTVREWARLQCFPDWYQFYGPRTTGGQRRAGNPHQRLYAREVPKYTQIGNAVPVKLARLVGQHFAKILAIAAKT